MNIQDPMLGQVSWPPNRQACYVRVSIPSREKDGLPLSIKATFTGIDRRNLSKDTVVEVVRTDAKDARRFKITRLFKDVMEKPKSAKVELVAAVDVEINVHVEDADHFRNKVQYEDRLQRLYGCSRVGRPTQGQRMQARNEKNDKDKADRVRFFIGRRYYHEQRNRHAMKRVLSAALSIGVSEFASLSSNGSNLGFWVECREDQFARFMIYRDQEGLMNGFQDLRVEHTDDNNARKCDRMAHVADR